MMRGWKSGLALLSFRITWIPCHTVVHFEFALCCSFVPWVSLLFPQPKKILWLQHEPGLKPRLLLLLLGPRNPKLQNVKR